MYTKPVFSSMGVLFFLLLFSKPFVARCQTNPTNEPVKKVVRIEMDTVIKSMRDNGEKIIIIEDGSTPEGFNEAELTEGNVVVIEKTIITTTYNKRRHKRRAPVEEEKHIVIKKTVDNKP